VFMLEANANPNLARNEDFAESAAAADMDYRELLERIMTLGRNYRVEWRE
jgi:D-alanine-D-alanine ligase-like ATP-grasp enzyme